MTTLQDCSVPFLFVGVKLRNCQDSARTSVMFAAWWFLRLMDVTLTPTQAPQGCWISQLFIKNWLGNSTRAPLSIWHWMWAGKKSQTSRASSLRSKSAICTINTSLYLHSLHGKKVSLCIGLDYFLVHDSGALWNGLVCATHSLSYSLLVASESIATRWLRQIFLTGTCIKL